MKGTLSLAVVVTGMLLFPEAGLTQAKQKAAPWEFFVAFAMDGAGAGVKRKWGNQRTVQHGLTAQWVGSRGEDEERYLDYYTGVVDTYRSRYMFLFPVHYTLQRRLFSESIEDNFRPFVEMDIGPTVGVRIPTGHGFGGDFSRAQSQITIGGFLGVGMEFQIGKHSLLKLSGGYRQATFFNKFERWDTVEDPQGGTQRVKIVPDERSFSSVEIRMGLVTGI